MTESTQSVFRSLAPIGLMLLLSGCAPSPVAPDDEPIAAIGPAHVLEDSAAVGERVIWGGRIAAVRNLPDRTELTVISYPLDRGDRPRLGAEPGVRFILRYPGFLEPVQYAPGRFLTALGTVAGIDTAPVGEHVLDHPVLEGERLHLWPADVSRWQGQTRFSVGIGVRL